MGFMDLVRGLVSKVLPEEKAPREKSVSKKNKKVKKEKRSKTAKKVKPSAAGTAGKKAKKSADRSIKKSISSRKTVSKVSRNNIAGSKEKEIGRITHYFGKISVGIIKLKAPLKTGVRVRIKGKHDDFVQSISSMQISHKNVLTAAKGKEIGVKVKKRVHENDKVYLIV